MGQGREGFRRHSRLIVGNAALLVETMVARDRYSLKDPMSNRPLVVLLDDYEHAARRLADWSAVETLAELRICQAPLRADAEHHGNLTTSSAARTLRHGPPQFHHLTHVCADAHLST